MTLWEIVGTVNNKKKNKKYIYLATNDNIDFNEIKNNFLNSEYEVLTDLEVINNKKLNDTFIMEIDPEMTIVWEG